jgi:hypothetical protein
MGYCRQQVCSRELNPGDARADVSYKLWEVRQVNFRNELRLTLLLCSHETPARIPGTWLARANLHRANATWKYRCRDAFWSVKKLADGPTLCKYGGKGRGGERRNIIPSWKLLAPNLLLEHFTGQKILPPLYIRFPSSSNEFGERRKEYERPSLCGNGNKLRPA